MLTLQLVAVAEMPLNATALVPWLSPKLEPLIVTEDPPTPEPGTTLVICGITVKPTGVLDTPLTVTTALLAPPVPLEGTSTVIELTPQVIIVAGVELKVTDP